MATIKELNIAGSILLHCAFNDLMSHTEFSNIYFETIASKFASGFSIVTEIVCVCISNILRLAIS